MTTFESCHQKSLRKSIGKMCSNIFPTFESELEHGRVTGTGGGVTGHTHPDEVWSAGSKFPHFGGEFLMDRIDGNSQKNMQNNWKIKEHNNQAFVGR